VVAEQLVERTRDMILAEIKAKISAALLAVRTERSDPRVTTEIPRQYFIFDGAHTYNCPAVFVVVDSMDFPESSYGPNHINNLVKIYCSAVVEDRDMAFLTIKAERYQAALCRILHRTILQDDPNFIKIYSRVLRAEFSPIFTRKEKTNEGIFRKEVSLELEVKHFENPN